MIAAEQKRQETTFRLNVEPISHSSAFQTFYRDFEDGKTNSVRFQDVIGSKGWIYSTLRLKRSLWFLPQRVKCLQKSQIPSLCIL